MTSNVHLYLDDDVALDDIAFADEQEDPGEILERPDGYYWQAPDGHAEFGPFRSYELAQADRDAVGDDALDIGEALRQVEGDIGINDWIDAETGAPAWGQSPIHLELQ